MAGTTTTNEMGSLARREFIKTQVLRAIHFPEAPNTTIEFSQDLYTRLGVVYNTIADAWEDELIQKSKQTQPHVKLPSSTMVLLNVYSAITDVQRLANEGQQSRANEMGKVVRFWSEFAAVMLALESKTQ